VIDVGLIGFGLAGRAFHAPVICRVPGLRLAAILQRSANDAAQAYPAVQVVRTLDELLGVVKRLLTEADLYGEVLEVNHKR
jgi:scyllo-inositol 2-dehydrogenase (NADP+)